MRRIFFSFMTLFPLLTLSCTKLGFITLNSTSRLNKGFQVQKNIAYGDNKRQKLDVYFPKRNLKQAPVVVFFYGGSWQFGSKNDYRFMAKALSELGVVVVIPDYRLYPKVKFPAFVEDGAAAVDWVFKNIKDYSGNPNEVFVMGHSAGAHIASLLTFDPHYLKQYDSSKKWKLAGFIGLAGPYDFLPFTSEVFKDLFGPPDKFILSQPIHFITGREPRVLLIHGADDKTVWIRNSKNLAGKIASKNGTVITHYYQKLNHAMIVAKFSRLFRDSTLLENIKQFLF